MGNCEKRAVRFRPESDLIRRIVTYTSDQGERMQCSHCDTELGLKGVCPGCGHQTDVQTVPPHLTKQKSSHRIDIPWFAWSLSCALLLIASFAVTMDRMGSDVAKAQGYALAPALMAAGIAGLLHRVSGFRFRLTMALAQFALVGLLLAGDLQSLHAPTENLATAQGDDLSQSQSLYEIHWPDGWQVEKAPIPPEENLNGETVKVIKLEQGAPVAVFELMVAEKNGSVSTLQDTLKRSIDYAQELAERSGRKFQTEQPVPGYIGGVPSLSEDVHMSNGNEDVHESYSLVLGDKNACTLIFVASGGSYGRFQGEMLKTRDSLICH